MSLGIWIRGEWKSLTFFLDPDQRLEFPRYFEAVIGLIELNLWAGIGQERPAIGRIAA